MKKLLCLTAGLFVLLCLASPVSASIYSAESRYFGPGYEVSMNTDTRMSYWIVWNSQDEAKALDIPFDEIQNVDAFKDAVDNCYRVENDSIIAKSRMWSNFLNIFAVFRYMDLRDAALDEAAYYAEQADVLFEHL